MLRKIQLTLKWYWASTGQIEAFPWSGYESETAGLAVAHKPKSVVAGVYTPMRGWQVIHIKSGFPVRGTTLPTRKVALEVAKKLGALEDWTADAADIHNVSAEVSRARAAGIDRIYREALKGV